MKSLNLNNQDLDKSNDKFEKLMKAIVPSGATYRESELTVHDVENLWSKFKKTLEEMAIATNQSVVDYEITPLSFDNPGRFKTIYVMIYYLGKKLLETLYKGEALLQNNNKEWVPLKRGHIDSPEIKKCLEYGNLIYAIIDLKHELEKSEFIIIDTNLSYIWEIINCWLESLVNVNGDFQLCLAKLQSTLFDNDMLIYDILINLNLLRDNPILNISSKANK